MAVICWGTVTGILLLLFGASQTVIGRKTGKELLEKAVWIHFCGTVLTPAESRRFRHEEG